MVHRGLISQLNTTRSGRSKARIRAHRHSLPSTARSTMPPPTLGSNTELVDDHVGVYRRVIDVSAVDIEAG
jgi:hypothetical protein